MLKKIKLIFTWGGELDDFLGFDFFLALNIKLKEKMLTMFK